MPRFADLIVDIDASTVARGVVTLPVTDRSFELLRILLDQAPEVVSHRDLLDAVWPGQVVSPETLKQRVRLLRQALGEAPGPSEYIVSVHGRGYRLGYLVDNECAKSDRPEKRWLRAFVAVLAAALAAWMVSWLMRDESVPPPAATESIESQPAEAPPAPDTDAAEEPP